MLRSWTTAARCHFPTSMSLVLCLGPGLLGGCGVSLLSNAEAGYAHALGKSPEESAVAINAKSGAGFKLPLLPPIFGDDTSGIGYSVRTKLGPHMGQGALGTFAYRLIPLDSKQDQTLYLTAGISWLQLESVRGQFGYSLLSPSGGLGMAVAPLHMTFAVEAEYDWRFNDVPNTGYILFMAGWGSARGVRFDSPL